MREPTQVDLYTIAEELTGGRVLSITRAHGGGNNSIYYVDSTGGSAALKFYPPQDEDPRDRLGQEYEALAFLSANGVEQVPAPIGISREHHCAAYQWIDGMRVSEIGVNEVDAMATFLEQLQQLRCLDGAQALRPASASCLSPQAAADQLMARLVRLQDAARDCSSGADGLRDFLDDQLRPAALTAIEELDKACHAHGLSINTDLARQHQALSPSDFGFHNALRDNNGRIVFVDFEYFGWDDPVKMVSDIQLHPGMNLSDALAARFQERIIPVFDQDDADFSVRLGLLYPIFGLVWCTIILNEFLPERWARREAAGHADAEASRTRQMKKALTHFDRLRI